MNLKQDLIRERAHWDGFIPADKNAIMQADLDRLSRGELPLRALKAGERAPNFRLPAANGQSVELDALLVKGPVLLSFYRGEWCPYCNLELRAYQQLLSSIEKLGASLVAVSPQTPDHSLSTVEKNQLAFPVLSDVGSHVARAFGVAFDFTPALHDVYANFFGNDLTQFNGADGWVLPVPATYLIDRDARVIRADIDVDYRRRPDPQAFLATLSELQSPRLGRAA